MTNNKMTVAKIVKEIHYAINICTKLCNDEERDNVQDLMFRARIHELNHLLRFIRGD